MTPKELLYIEDALGHIKFMTTQCNEASSRLTLGIAGARAETQPI